MANDIDMWNDMEWFNRNQQVERGEELHLMYVAKFMTEDDDEEAERLKEAYEQKYKCSLKYW